MQMTLEIENQISKRMGWLEDATEENKWELQKAQET
jgi:hypothetical protein